MPWDIGGAYLGPLEQQQKMDESAAMAPLLRAHQIATTRMLNAQSTRMEGAEESEKRAAELMRRLLGGDAASTADMPGLWGREARQEPGSPATPGAAPAVPRSPAATMYSMANIFAQAGMPKEAQTALNQASLIQNREATQSDLRRRALEAAQKMHMKKAEIVTDILGDVTDQASWDRANDAYELRTGEPSPFKGVPYNPDLVEGLKMGSLKAKEKADLEVKIADLESKVRRRDAATAHGKAIEALREREAEARRLAAEAKRKAGGKDPGVPGTKESDAAGRLLDADTDLNLAPEDRQSAAFDIAAQARAKRIKNPGISADEALRQAYLEAKQRGDFTPGEAPRKVLGMTIPGTGKQGSYKAGGTAPPALALPTSGKASDLKVGQAYKNAAGVTKVWTGQGWQDPAPRAGAPTHPEPDVEPDDDEDEE